MTHMAEFSEISFPEEVTVTDQVIDVSGFSDAWRKDVRELAARIADAYRGSGQERFITAIGGASGSSKSTTTQVLRRLLTAHGLPAAAVGQDGYHFPQTHLRSKLDSRGEPLSAHKGRFDSYDVPSLKRDLERFKSGEPLSFPEYSRKAHDPIAEAIPVAGPALLLIEGLWLLYDAPPWSEMLSLYDLKVFFRAEPPVRMRNTVARHVRGNERALEDAERFYEESDRPNGEMLLAHVAPHDLDVSID